jgi:aldehyde dehydrogenase (NAD+)
MVSDVLDHYIDGKSVPPSSGDYVQTYEPATGALGIRVAKGSSADVSLAVGAASAAFPEWRDRKPIERGRVLLNIARGIRDRKGEFSELEARDSGKVPSHVPFEVEGAAAYFEFYGGLVNLYQGEKIDLGPHYHSYTVREPFGAVAVITPWNAPINQAARGIAPALAAGNTVVAKPSEFTSSTTRLLAQMAVEQCGIPPGVLNVVLGEGPEAGAAIVAHPNIRKVTFTGSVRAGREIGRIAAGRIIPLTLELGGISPNIVFEDADLSQALPGALRAFIVNAGQACIAGTRLLVQQSIHDAFVRGLADAAAHVKVGPQPDAMVGSITTRAQYERILGYFDLARVEGVRAVLGGELKKNDRAWDDGWYLPPTIYAGVTNDMQIAREEVFGPVLVIIPFDSEADAIRIANDTEYGLAAGIWTQNLSRAHRVASAIQAGQIYVNEYFAGGVETPLGGYKNSGFGREKGIEALHCYTQVKCITIKL